MGSAAPYFALQLYLYAMDYAVDKVNLKLEPVNVQSLLVKSVDTLFADKKLTQMEWKYTVRFPLEEATLEGT